MTCVRRNAPMTTALQTEYPSAPPVYGSPITNSAAATPPNGYAYGPPNPGITTPPPAPPSSQYATLSPIPTASSTNTAIPIAHLEVSTPSQGAIIAISVICSLLLLAFLFAILVIIGRRYESEHLHLDIEGGGGGHYRRRRRHRSEKTETELGRLDLGDIERERTRRMGAFGRPGPPPNRFGNLGLAPGWFPDPRTRMGGGQAGQVGRQEREREVGEEVEEVEELSDGSTTKASGTRTMRSASEKRESGSKVSSERTRGRHRGK